MSQTFFPGERTSACWYTNDEVDESEAAREMMDLVMSAIGGRYTTPMTVTINGHDIETDRSTVEVELPDDCPLLRGAGISRLGAAIEASGLDIQICSDTNYGGTVLLVLYVDR